MNLTEKKFYNLFWTNPVCREIFSVHKSRLLEGEVELIFSKEKSFAQRLVLTNSQKRKTGLQVVKRAENESIELMHDFKKSIEKYVDEKKIESYAMQKFGKTIGKIDKEISRKGWIRFAIKVLSSIDSEQNFFKLLTEYHILPTGIESEEQFKDYAEKEFRSLFDSFKKNHSPSELAISIDLASTYYNNKIKHSLVSGSKHYTDILLDNENYSSRILFFDDLYEIEAIKGGIQKSYYECVRCPPGTFNGIMTTDLKPSSLKMKCPNCKKEMHYVVPYDLDSNLYKNVIHKDGVLLFAIQYLLEENKYSFAINQTFSKDIEVDICLLNEDDSVYETVEVKMFKIDRPDDTQVGNIRSAVAQIKKMVDKLSNEVDPEFKSIEHSLVTNIRSESVYETAQKELEKDLCKYNITIYTIEEYYLNMKK